MHDKMHPLMVNIIPLVDLIAEAFGKNCEVALFEMSSNNSIIYIANGHVTGRKVGDTMRQHEITSIQNVNGHNKVLNYSSTTKEGRTLKSSMYFIKNDSEQNIGCLCINFDVSDLVVASKALENLLSIGQCQTNNVKDNINDILIDIVNSTLNSIGIPISYLNKDDKVEIVKKLNDKGLFLIKGAVDYVAERLCVSRYTIYNYLEEIKLGDN